MSFEASALYGGSCTAGGVFRRVQVLCRGGILISIYQGVLGFLEAVGVFKVSRGCIFVIPHTYLEFSWIAEVEWESDGNVGWCTYSAGDSVLSDIPGREISVCKGSLQDDVLSFHVDTVQICFLDQLFSLADAGYVTTAVLGFSEEVEEQEQDDVEDGIENVWGMSDLRRGNHRSPSTLERVKSLCESFSLPMPTTVLEVR